MAINQLRLWHLSRLCRLSGQNTALHVAEDVACDQMHVQLLGANLPGVLQVWKMVHL